MSGNIKINARNNGGSNYKVELLLIAILCEMVHSDKQTLREDVIHLSSTDIPNYPTEGHCVMYGLCGDLDFSGEQTCRVNHPPKNLDAESLADLRKFCPELIDKHGPKLCCSSDQVEMLVKDLSIPQALIGRCPSCFHNFRRSICEFTCSPIQSEFLNVTEVAPTSEDALEEQPDLPKEVVRKVDFFISKKYIEDTFESCKNVIMAATDGPAMDLLCGPWGSLRCTPERWYEFLGSTSNGYSPFDIIYRPIDTEKHGQLYQSNSTKVNGTIMQGVTEVVRELPDEIKPLDIPTYSCGEVPPGKTKRCSCVDCPASCPVKPSPTQGTAYKEIPSATLSFATIQQSAQQQVLLAILFVCIFN